MDLVGSLCVSCCCCCCSCCCCCCCCCGPSLWIFVGGPSVVDLLVDTFLWPLYVFWWSSVHPTDPRACLVGLQAKTVFAHLICLFCLYLSLVFPESLLVFVGFCMNAALASFAIHLWFATMPVWYSLACFWCASAVSSGYFCFWIWILLLLEVWASCFANLSLIWVHGLWPANHLWFLQATIFLLSLLSLLVLVSNQFL